MGTAVPVCLSEWTKEEQWPIHETSEIPALNLLLRPMRPKENLWQGNTKAAAAQRVGLVEAGRRQIPGPRLPVVGIASWENLCHQETAWGCRHPPRSLLGGQACHAVRRFTQAGLCIGYFCPDSPPSDQSFLDISPQSTEVAMFHYTTEPGQSPIEHSARQQ